MASVPGLKNIKSAQRVTEVFEFFNANRREATVMEIAREYGYPQSSTSELLNCLVHLGYLRRDRSARTYRPTARMAVIGSWVEPRLFRNGTLLSMMDDLAAETGQEIALVGIVGLNAQCFQIVSGERSLSAAYISDSLTPLTWASVGHLLLTTVDRGLVRKYVHRLNAEAEPDRRVRAEDLLVEIDQISRQGFAFGAGLISDPGPMLSVLLPTAASGETLALGIQGTAVNYETHDYLIRELRSTISRHLDPVLVSPSQIPSPIEQSLRIVAMG